MSKTWRDTAACLTEEPDLFHPDELTSPAVEAAKTVCRRCPAVDACLQHAIDNRIEDGIHGGLTAGERQSLRRAIARQRLTVQAAAARAEQLRQPQPSKPCTVAEYLARHTVRIFGGHLEWAGPKRPWIAGRSYTPAQLVFAADRGRQPEGRVKAGCMHAGCIKPGHLTDDVERAVTTRAALAAA